MQVIPSTLPSGLKSDAERRLFEDFQTVDTGKGSVCFHSLRLSRHEYKREGELDFVALSPFGLIVLEVKGGGVARGYDGIWTYTDRYDRNYRSSEGPFQQARSGMYSLVDELRRLGDEKDFRDLVYGFGVVFPDCNFRDIEVVEWDNEMILDARNYQDASDLDHFASALINYWRDRVGAENRRLKRRQIDRYRRFLRPKFDRVPTLGHRADELVRRMEDLTAEQYRILDAVENNSRILCSGGAGTGKTFIAAEIARRHADSGEQVLFTCRNSTLSSYLQPRLANDRIDVIAFEGLNKAGKQYDVLILDEGQDLLDFDHLDQLDELVTGGLEAGTWRFFYDQNNQSGIYRTFSHEAVSLLESYGAVSLQLSRNCRNTHEIVLQTKLVTAADLGSPSAGHGPEVKYRFFESRAENVRYLETRTQELLNNEVEPGAITILSPCSFSQSVASSLPSEFKTAIKAVDSTTGASFPFEDIAFSSITNFKGLENQFVILVDVKELGDTSDEITPLYVAMSRAQISLTVIVPAHLEKEITDRTLSNMEKMSEDFRPR